jgi:hypothetical protein
VFRQRLDPAKDLACPNCCPSWSWGFHYFRVSIDARPLDRQLAHSTSCFWRGEVVLQPHLGWQHSTPVRAASPTVPSLGVSSLDLGPGEGCGSSLAPFSLKRRFTAVGRGPWRRCQMKRQRALAPGILFLLSDSGVAALATGDGDYIGQHCFSRTHRASPRHRGCARRS